MGNLANQALARARAGLLSKTVSRRPASTPEKTSSPPARPAGYRVDICGPINQVMYREGRTWALELVKSLRASPLEAVIERLEGAAAGRPGSYASGINSVVRNLREANVKSGPIPAVQGVGDD